MLHRLAVAHQQAAENLKEARTPLEVMALQSQLMLAGWNETAQYTMQLLGALQNVKASEPSAPSTGRRRGAAAVPQTGMPMFDAWQRMMTTLNGSQS